jgi:hypothetical protein
VEARLANLPPLIGMEAGIGAHPTASARPRTGPESSTTDIG